MTIDRLRDALEALGPPVTPLELAEMLWLAERLPAEAGDGAGAGTGPVGAGIRAGGGLSAGPPSVDSTGAADGAARAKAPGPAEPGADTAPAADGEHRAALHLPRGLAERGTDADEVLVPAPQALRHELAIQRALRPLKQSVPDRRHPTLDEEATAARAARRPDVRPWAPVMVPGADRLLSLALVVDTGPSMTVWRPLVRELREAMQRTGAFRDVRLWQLKDLGTRLGIRSSPDGPAVDPAALIDPTGRQVVLVLSDCSGPHWWEGRAGPALHRWARHGPTAILQPLPERLWRRTAAPAAPGRAIASRAGAPNTGLRFTPHDGRTGRPAGAVPVPVLELAPDWLADWAGLLTAAGDRHRDTAVTYVSARPSAHAAPLPSEADLSIAERIMRFQSAASPTAADLAAHIALSVPALPVMRLIQQRVTPGSRPSDLAEVLLSGLLEPVDPGAGLYGFVPGARGALIETLPRPESLAVAELLERLGEEIECRAGSAPRAFRALVAVAKGAGSRRLGAAGQPFALVSEEALGLLRSTAIPVVETSVTVNISLPPDFGQELRRARTAAGLSLTELAGIVHYSKGHLSKIERGMKRPTRHLARMCDLTLRAGGALASLLPPDTTGAQAGELTVGPAALLGPPASVPCPRRLTNLPRKVPFVGRRDEIAQLDAKFHRLLSPSENFTAVLHGMGGMGKTALAREWAGRGLEGDAFTLVWWINAESQVSIDEGLADLTAALAPSLAGLLVREQQKEWALKWLAAQEDWLLVLDDAADTAHVGLLMSRIGSGGRFLITSRQGTGWHALPAAVLSLDPMELPEAVELLTRRLHGEVPEGAERLCEALGCHPLALDQAGAWLAETRMPVGEYLRLIENSRHGLIEGGPPGPVPVSGIAETWKAVLHQLDDPLAKRILTTVSWYAPETVPLDVLSGLAPATEMARALEILARSGLIRSAPASIAMHQMVGILVQTPDEHDPYRTSEALVQARAAAVDCVAKALPESPENPGTWHRWSELAPLIETLAAHTLATGDGPRLVTSVEGLADYFIVQGQANKAVSVLLRLVGTAERTHGPTAPAAQLAKAKFAAALRAAGYVERSIATYEEVLAVLIGELRDDDPDVSSLQAELAGAYQALGDFGHAVALYEESEVRTAAVYGDEHPHTLQVRASRAGAYVEWGEPDGVSFALALYEGTLLASRRAMGDDHPDTIAVRSGLAAAYYAAGEVGRARSEAEQVLLDSRRVLGADHPRTLTAQSDLARAYEGAGETEEALRAYEDALAASLRVRGASHPDTLRLYEQLAHACVEQGEHDRAIELYERALTERIASRGPDHPDTLLVAEHLADVYGLDRTWEKSAALHEHTLDARIRVRGADHPDTRRSYASLVAALRAAGRHERADAVERRRDAPTRNEPDGDAPD
ncbi:SAV_2336 N-terminal domain-related protein [Streptomyces sp. NPDC057302]|uniref:SAV_2336 N-terminal domain-related protein n=1 Tax=Streptomyces sp. NPDC057302 TaxID=3346094 RepID=UPI00363C44F6